jgi:hypothetical protein
LGLRLFRVVGFSGGGCVCRLIPGRLVNRARLGRGLRRSRRLVRDLTLVLKTNNFIGRSGRDGIIVRGGSFIEENRINKKSGGAQNK